MEETKEWISDIEHTIMGNNKDEQKRERIKDRESTLRKLSDSKKYNNTYIIGISEEKREKSEEDVFEKIRDKNSPNLGKKPDIQM